MNPVFAARRKAVDGATRMFVFLATRPIDFPKLLVSSERSALSISCPSCVFKLYIINIVYSIITIYNTIYVLT